MCTYCTIGDGQIDKRCHFRRPVLTRLSPATTFSAVQFYDRLGDLPSRVFARQLKVLTRQINYKGNAHWYLTMKNYLIRGSLCARNTIYVFLTEWAVIRAFAANSELAIFPYCPYYSHSANWNSRGMSHSSHTFPERGHRIPYILCFGLWGRVPIFFCSNFRYEPFLLPKQCGKKIYFRFNFSLAKTRQGESAHSRARSIQEIL